MGKLEYLDALRRAMQGIAPETQAKTMAFYEQRFVDGADAGRSEAEIATELGDPKKIAMSLRASVHMQSFESKRNPANFVRMAFAAIGLLIFNLVMVVPAMVYAALLAGLYSTGLALYLYGVVITASGLSGTTEITIDSPLNSVAHGQRRADSERETKVAISGGNIQIYTEPTPGAAADGNDDATEGDNEDQRPLRTLRRAEQIATIGMKFNTEMDQASRTTQSLLGFGLVLGGILVLLLCLVVSRYTLIAARRYLDMNISLLKGN